MNEGNHFFSWRRLRKAANEGFSKGAVKGFYETQMTEAVVQASDLLIGPARWDQHLRRAAASTTLSILYGYPTAKSEQDPVVEVMNDFSDRLFKAAIMGAHPVQIFPWLRHIPSRRVPSIHDPNLFIKKLFKKPGEMETRRRSLAQDKNCDARRPFSYG